MPPSMITMTSSQAAWLNKLVQLSGSKIKPVLMEVDDLATNDECDKKLFKTKRTKKVEGQVVDPFSMTQVIFQVQREDQKLDSFINSISCEKQEEKDRETNSSENDKIEDKKDLIKIQ